MELSIHSEAIETTEEQQKQPRKRRRTEIKRIEEKPRRMTTFSKRRDGLFKKTRELCNLCGADAAIIAITEAGNTYAFGKPTVKSVVDRYLAENSTKNADEKEKRLTELQDKYAAALSRLEAEKKRGEMLDATMAKGQTLFLGGEGAQDDGGGNKRRR